MVRVGRRMLWYTLSQYFGIATCIFSGMTSGPSVATACKGALSGPSQCPPETKTGHTRKVQRCAANRSLVYFSPREQKAQQM